MIGRRKSLHQNFALGLSLSVYEEHCPGVLGENVEEPAVRVAPVSNFNSTSI